MATNFPTTIDAFSNPVGTDKVANVNPALKHGTQHANANDAIEAIEAKVGADGSAVTTSHDYKLGEVIGSDKAVSKTATQTLTNKTLTSPVINEIVNTGTLSLPTSTDTLVGRATTDTLTNKTLTSPTITTPTISSTGFTNAQHAHTGATSGGQLNASSVFSAGTVPTARLGSGTANSTTYLRGDSTWATVSNTFACGDGSDGNVTISSPTTLTRDMYYNDLTVTSTLTTAGWRIFVAGTLSGAGTITDARTGQTGRASGYLPAIAAGGNAGTGGNNSGGTAGTAGTSYANSIGKSAGAGGGGAAGGTVTDVVHKFGVLSWLTFAMLDITNAAVTFTKINASASGGGGNGGTGGPASFGGNGGVGGAGGGIVFIVVNTWAGTFTITSAGGNGANGTNASGTFASNGGGGGGGGGGGTNIVIYNTKTWSGSHNVAGGTAGTGGAGIAGGSAGANGVAGTAGTTYELNIANLTR